MLIGLVRIVLLSSGRREARAAPLLAMITERASTPTIALRVARTSSLDAA